MSNKVRTIQKARERQQARDGQIVVALNVLINSAMQTDKNPVPALHNLLGQRDIPIRQSFLIGKIAKSVFAEIESYQASYKTLCEKYANKTNEGKAIILGADNKPVEEGKPGRYDIPAEKVPDFEKEHVELLTTEIEIPGQQIKVNGLEGAKIAPAHLMQLDWLITE